MYGSVEFIERIGRARAFGNAEQCRLHARASLAFGHFGLQYGVRISQSPGPLLDATLELFLRLFAFERGQHMLRDVVQQRAVLFRITLVGAIALHDDRAANRVGADHRNPEPVLTVRTEARIARDAEVVANLVRGAICDLPMAHAERQRFESPTVESRRPD